MTIYGYPEDKFEPKFLEAIKAAEYQFLRDTQNYSLKNDLSSNELLSPEYKRAFIKMPEANYDGGVIFSFKEEAKKQGKDNVLFTPLLTADENRAAFDSLREDYKEKLTREFEKRDIKYDNNLLNALSSRDSHRISMTIAQNGLKERDISLALNTVQKTAQKPIVEDIKKENYELDPKKEKWFIDNDTLPYQNATMVNGNKDMEDAYFAFAEKKKEEALDAISAEAKDVERPKSKVTAESLGIDTKAEMENLANMAIEKAKTNRYYSLGSAYGGTEPRFDCSLWVRQTLEAQFKNYPGWSASNNTMWTSEGIFKTCVDVAGSHEEYRNMDRYSQPEREKMLLDIISKVGPGGIIATDKGPTRSGFDAGREYGIDHILRVVEKDGKLYMSHTTMAAPKGTLFESVEEWAHKYSKSVKNVFGVNGDDLRDGMANGEFKHHPKAREHMMGNMRNTLEGDIKEFAMSHNIDPRVASAYIKYNNSYEKFAEAVKNIDDNPAATWNKLQDYLSKDAKNKGIDYPFDKNDSLLEKIFALFGMMLDENIKEQAVNNNTLETKTIASNEPSNVEKSKSVEDGHNVAAANEKEKTERKIAGYKTIIYDDGKIEKLPIYRDQLDDLGKHVYGSLDDAEGATESDPNITSTTIKKELEGLDIGKLAPSEEQKTDISNYPNPSNDMNI